MMLAVLNLGDVAFTGFQATTTDKISLVLLKGVDAGTVMTVTDNSWSGSALSTNEGNSTITFNGTFSAGTQINFDASRVAGSRWAVGNSTANISDATTDFFALNAAGDNLFVYNGTQAPTSGSSASWVSAFSTTAFLTSGATSTNRTYLPAVFSATDSQLTLNLTVGSSNQNGAYTGQSVTGTAVQIRAAVHNRANWTAFTTAGGQPIPPAATFSINGGGTNSPPTGLSLSNNTIPENAAPNTVVGTLSTADPNSGDSFTYSLVAGSGSTNNDRFDVNGAELRATTSFDFETQNSYSVRLRTTDQGGLTFEQVFQIQVLDVVEGVATNLRIVSYNIAAVDGIRSGLSTILQAIGSEVVAGISRPIDVLALQEVSSQATTTATVAGLLNSIYGAAIYATGTLDGASTGSGTQGVVYNTQSVQLLGEATIGVASASGQPRQTLRHHFKPVGGAASTEFYVYNGHWKALDDADSADRRQIEAQAIRANADSLGNGKNILYVGDFNTYSGNEAAFQTLLAAGNGKGLDPANRVGSWSNNSTYRDIMTQAPAVNAPSGLTGGGLDDRFDFQVVSQELTDGFGLEYQSGSYRAFGNNGSVVLNGSINSSSSTALPGLANRTTVLNLLTTVSDHLPVVADFSLPPTLVNRAPLGGDSKVKTYINVPYTFTLADFKFSDPNNSPPDAFDALRISELPTAGVLTLSGSAVTVGQFIPVSQIASGSFRYVPPSNRIGLPIASFKFQVRDSGGTANGGSNLDPVPNTILLNVDQSRSTMSPNSNSLATNSTAWPVASMGTWPLEAALKAPTIDISRGRPNQRCDSRNAFATVVVQSHDRARQVDDGSSGHEMIRQNVMNLKFLDDYQPEVFGLAENHLTDSDKFALRDESFVSMMILGL
jgi:endonuclease/exonuclease/phosphatase family metal-dependent hydrolase